MKSFITYLLIFELLIAYFVFTPSCILRTAHINASSAWVHNPTPETRAEMNRQGHVTGLIRLAVFAVFFFLMAGPTLAAGWVWRRKHPIKSEAKAEKEARATYDY